LAEWGEPPACPVAPPASKAPSDTPVAQSARVALFGEDKATMVDGKERPPLSKARYAVVRALIAAGDTGLTKDQLDDKSGHTEARKIMGGLAKSDPAWGAVLKLAGTTGGHYRIL